MKICWIRHGEATHNVAALTQGDSAYSDPAHRDASLTNEGIQQAKNTQLPWKPTHVFSSPCLRAIQTAEIVAPHLPIFVDWRLLEQKHAGHVCNTPKLQETLGGWFGERISAVRGVPPKDGETAEQVVARFQSFLQEIKRDLGDKAQVLLWTHHDAVNAYKGNRRANCEWLEENH